MTLSHASYEKWGSVDLHLHSVWKSQKKSHSTLRAKRATFTFWVDKSSLKGPKMVNFGEFLKTWSFWSNSATRQVNFKRTKIGGKRQNYVVGWFSNIVPSVPWKAKKIIYFSHKNVRVPRGKLFFYWKEGRTHVHHLQSSSQLCLRYYEALFTIIFLAWSKKIMQKGRRGFRPEWMQQKFCTKEAVGAVAFSFEKSIGKGWTRVRRRTG